MSNKFVSINDWKKMVDNTQETIDKNGSVELKQVFFDKVLWTTAKAICIQKGSTKAWIARKVIAEINLETDDVCDLWCPVWVVTNWRGEKE